MDHHLTRTSVPLAEYLSASYDPDVEFVDGALVERNVGEWLHSLVQSNLICTCGGSTPTCLRCRNSPLVPKKPAIDCRTFPLCSSLPQAGFLPEAAHIAIEILSKDDRMSKSKSRRILDGGSWPHLADAIFGVGERDSIRLLHKFGAIERDDVLSLPRSFCSNGRTWPRS